MTTSLPERAGFGGLGVDPAGSYRVVNEAEIVLAIAHHGRPFDILANDRNGQEAVDEAARSLERWVERGLQYRRAGGRRYFDPFETLNFMVRAGREWCDTSWGSRGVRRPRAWLDLVLRLASERCANAPLCSHRGSAHPRP